MKRIITIVFFLFLRDLLDEGRKIKEEVDGI